MTVTVGEVAARPPVGAWTLAQLDRAQVLKLLVVVGQFALLVGLIRQFQIESRTFFNVMVLAGVGFVVHTLLPLRLRMPWFALLSLGTIGLVFGLGGGAWLVGIGALLIGLCHLPVAFGVRVALVLGTAALLAASRTHWIPLNVPAPVWPILGSMFMFRLALYLHSPRHQEAPLSLSHAVAYFFMLPNVCFPLFPVVDYKTFVRTHFDGDPYEIYQRGVRWMLRGVAHLLLYRIVYYHLTLDPTKLQSLSDLVQYILTTFLLYLRVSGQFHLIVGMLHLFGFRLPETHHLYFLSSSFTDFWRRINIYWKDFMMKLVYYPSFFRLRRLGNTTALVASTTIVFVITWLLHSYQWFWLRGSFPLTLTDALFWGTLGALVVVATVRESRKRQVRTRRDQPWSAGLAVRRVGTFTAIAVLWSLWNSESLAEWFGALGAARHVDLQGVLLLTGLLVGALVIFGKAWGVADLKDLQPAPVPLRQYLQGAGLAAASMAGLLLLGGPALHARIGGQFASVAGSLRQTRLSSQDAATLQRGYYENLGNVNRFNTQVWEVFSRRPPDDWQQLRSTRAMLTRDDLLGWELAPSVSMVFKGAPLSTNRWGMRDRDYEQVKPPRTLRIALLGPSFVMGAGVGDGETFEAVLEEQVNREPGAKPRVEILNFSVSGYSLVQQLEILRLRVWDFHPDVVMVTCNPHDGPSVARFLANSARSGVPIPQEDLKQMLAEAGVGKGTDSATAIRQLTPVIDRLVTWILRTLVAEIRQHGGTPLVLAMRMPTEEASELARWTTPASEAGATVIDLSDAFQGHDESTLRLAEWDNHPNAEGHRLLAERLRFALREISLMPLDRTDDRTATPYDSEAARLWTTSSGQ